LLSLGLLSCVYAWHCIGKREHMKEAP